LGQNQTYLQALTRAGATPLLIPHLVDETPLRSLYDLLDGLLLPGGVDVDPARYGEARHEECGQSSPDQDETEIRLARWAVNEGKPLLAICRGIQVLNVTLGGSLYQDINSQIPGSEKHDWYPGYARVHLPHSVTITPQTRLATILGESVVRVNSLHHQAIKDIAPGLLATGHTPDGILEAVEVEAHPFAIGVQWHPEELAPTDPRAQRLFDELIEACQR
jgi:putative glutamine amidotransferase